MATFQRLTQLQGEDESESWSDSITMRTTTFGNDTKGFHDLDTQDGAGTCSSSGNDSDNDGQRKQDKISLIVASRRIKHRKSMIYCKKQRKWILYQRTCQEIYCKHLGICCIVILLLLITAFILYFGYIFMKRNLEQLNEYQTYNIQIECICVNVIFFNEFMNIGL